MKEAEERVLYPIPRRAEITESPARSDSHWTFPRQTLILLCYDAEKVTPKLVKVKQGQTVFPDRSEMNQVLALFKTNCLILQNQIKFEDLIALFDLIT